MVLVLLVIGQYIAVSTQMVQYAYINSVQARLYDSPSLELPTNGYVYRGDRVRILMTENNWQRIDGGSGRTGWIHGALLSQKKPEQTPTVLEQLPTIQPSHRMRASSYTNTAAARGFWSDSTGIYSRFHAFSEDPVFEMEQLVVPLEEGRIFIQMATNDTK